MIWNKYVFLTIITFIVTNVLVWYQLNGQLVWEYWKSNKGILLSLVLAVPVTLGFWYATKVGYQGLGSLWSVRFMGFATSMLVFPFMTYFYLGEPMTIKVMLTLLLSILIMLLQLTNT
tara:strand:+ start:137 stop:490 length:354 start_codon:yes stop_codon:yes gene_type:complete